jgi:hypothetical protein
MHRHRACEFTIGAFATRALPEFRMIRSMTAFASGERAT